jgi:citrate lyase subunit beta/citryl-CoA lyase
VLTPSPQEVVRARRIVAAFEAAQAKGHARVELDGSLVETPIYTNAMRLIARAEALGS